MDLMHCERFLFRWVRVKFVTRGHFISFVAVQSSRAFQLDECSIWGWFLVAGLWYFYFRQGNFVFFFWLSFVQPAVV
jgi:hypothetical protein